MRVLFLTLYPDLAASPRYRVAQFLPGLRARGIACTVASAVSEAVWMRHQGAGPRPRAFWYHAHETPRRIAQLAGARGHDVIFVQKALASAYVRGLPALLRRAGRPVIYDLDDAVHLAPPHPLRGPWRALEDRGQANTLFRMAARTLAGNAWLRDEAARAGARAACFPTVVDTERFRPPATPPPGFRLGWIGSPSTTPSLAEAAEALRGLPDTEVLLVGADPARVDWPGARVAGWALDTEVAMLQSFSVGLLPQARDAWSQGKCALKAVLCMACGVPCVATPFGAARDLIEDGVSGCFADSPAAWRAAVDRLRDPVLRAEMGAAARATVEARYALAGALPRMAEHLEAAACGA
jgi:glycosyltransferase involved in cell wall biosynthesis